MWVFLLLNNPARSQTGGGIAILFISYNPANYPQEIQQDGPQPIDSYDLDFSLVPGVSQYGDLGRLIVNV